MAHPPIARIDDQVADGPGGVIHEETLDVAYLAVPGSDVVPLTAWQLRRWGSPRQREGLARADTVAAPIRVVANVRGRYERIIILAPNARTTQ